MRRSLFQRILQAIFESLKRSCHRKGVEQVVRSIRVTQVMHSVAERRIYSE